MKTFEVGYDSRQVDESKCRIILSGIAKPDQPQRGSAFDAKREASKCRPPIKFHIIQCVIDDNARPADSVRQFWRGDRDCIDALDHPPQAVRPLRRTDKMVVAEVEDCSYAKTTQMSRNGEVFVAIRFLKDDGAISMHLRAVEEFALPAGSAQVFERPETAKPGAREFRRRCRGLPGDRGWRRHAVAMA